MLNYNELIEKYKTNYEIVKLVKQGKSYKELAGQYRLSTVRIAQKYRKFLLELYRNYCLYLESVQIDLKAKEISAFYDSMPVAIAYMEKTYKSHLEVFRNGNPPMMYGYYTDFPPFRLLGENQIAELEKKIINARENQRKTFSDIGKALELTKEKTKWIYDHYYNQKVMKAIKIIRSSVDLQTTQDVLERANSPYKKWQLLVNKYGALLRELIY